jgi:hypothetical protein
VLQHAELTGLEESLDRIRSAPQDAGTVELIARRPAEDEREVLTEARLDIRDGPRVIPGARVAAAERLTAAQIRTRS